jgi:hypothetical protein
MLPEWNPVRGVSGRGERFTCPLTPKRPAPAKEINRPSIEEAIMAQLALVDSLTTSVPQQARPWSPRIVSRAEIEACRRSPVLAALLTDDLTTGRAVLSTRLTDAQALRLTAADPRDLYRVRGLKPAQRAEIETNGANFQSVAEWRYGHKKLRQAARRAALKAATA